LAIERNNSDVEGYLEEYERDFEGLKGLKEEM